MSTRSITPCTSCSEPIGISVATTCGPKAPFSCSSVRKKSARSRSSMFTNSMRAMSSSAARAHRRLVVTSTPITALTTNTADSHTRSAPSASATKLGSPGVSIRLILRSCHSNELSVAEIDIWRACSSGSESETVVPSGTVPSRWWRPPRTAAPRAGRSCRPRGGRPARRCGSGPLGDGPRCLACFLPSLAVRPPYRQGLLHESAGADGSAHVLHRAAGPALRCAILWH